MSTTKVEQLRRSLEERARTRTMGVAGSLESRSSLFATGGFSFEQVGGNGGSGGRGVGDFPTYAVVDLF